MLLYFLNSVASPARAETQSYTFSVDLAQKDPQGLLFPELILTYFYWF